MHKKSKAWLVIDEADSTAEIVFSNHKLEARRIGAGRFNTEVEHVSITRRKDFDMFKDAGFVPPLALIKAGFEIACHECGLVIVNESVVGDERRTSAINAVEKGEHLFCGQGCSAAYESKVADRNRKFVEFKEKVIKSRPDLKFTEFTGGWPWITMTAKFTFEGCQFGGSVRDQEGTGTLDWYIAGGDKEMWAKYEQVRTDAAPVEEPVQHA